MPSRYSELSVGAHRVSVRHDVDDGDVHDDVHNDDADDYYPAVCVCVCLFWSAVGSPTSWWLCRA